MSGNVVCGVCHMRTASWRCACAGVPICQESGCLGKHLSAASATPHLLTPCEHEVLFSQEEAKQNLRDYDSAVEVSRFLEEERQWLDSKQAEIMRNIDIEADRLCEIIRSAASDAKQQVGIEAEKAINFLREFQGKERREFVLKVKSEGGHLVKFDLKVGEINAKELLQVSVRGTEKTIYKNMDGNGGEWKCGGSSIDALTLQPSRPINLSGLLLGRPKNSPIEVKILQVMEGESTQSRVIYTHKVPVILNSSMSSPLIQFANPVLMEAGRKYTLKLQLAGGDMTRGVSLYPARVQDDLEIILFKSIFQGEDSDNGSCPTGGIFCGFEYYPLA